MSPFGQTLGSEAELRTISSPPDKGAVAQQLDHLDDHCRAFIGHSPFVLIGTSGADGSGDVSPKGGPPGFVTVLDEHRLAMGELPGNNRIDSYINVVATGTVGMLFLIPGLDECLRVNGKGYAVTEPSVLEACAVGGKLPKVALGLEVTEAFIHCAKAIRRGQIWQPPNWPDTADLPK